MCSRPLPGVQPLPAANHGTRGQSAACKPRVAALCLPSQSKCLLHNAACRYEEATRIPLVFSNPQLYPKPVESNALVSHIDVRPRGGAGGKGPAAPL